MTDEKKETSLQAFTQFGAGPGAAIGLLLGSAFGDLIIGSSTVAMAGMVVGALIGGYVGARIRPPRNMMEFTARNYTNLWVGAIGLLVSLILMQHFGGGAISPLVDTLLSLLTIAFLLAFLISAGRAISSLDEFQRTIQLEAIATGFAISLFFVFSFTFLDMNAGFVAANWILVTCILSFSLVAGKIISIIRHR